MVQVASGDAYVIQGERALNDVMIANRGTELPQGDRKIGVLHLPGEGLLQTSAQVPRAIDIPDIAQHEQRGKEGEALDVVPVRMANKQVPVQRAWRRPCAPLPQSRTIRVPPAVWTSTHAVLPP